MSETNFTLKVSLSDTSGLTETARANRDLMVQVYHALEHGDQGALAAILDPEIKFFEAESLPYGVSAQGIEATLQGVGGMMNAWSKIHVDIEEFATAGDLVIAYMRFTGTSRATGKIYDAVCAEVFRFRAGRVIEWRPVYWDTHAARNACLKDAA
jgi:ketosteroid isomerase-like protein